MAHSSDSLRRIGQVLRVNIDDLAHEPLPERWVELILHLEEKEKRSRIRNIKRDA